MRYQTSTERAQAVLGAHNALYLGKDPDYNTNATTIDLMEVGGLLTDLRAWCRDNGVSFAVALEVSGHYHAVKELAREHGK